MIAIEILTAARSLDLRSAPSAAGPGPAPAAATGAVRDLLRRDVPGPGPDRHLAPEIDVAAALVASGAVLGAAESVTGPLH